MIQGKKINLRIVREKDLDRFFELMSDVEGKGDFYPLHLSSETGFKKQFREDGFWGETFGRLLIVDKEDDRILGGIWYFKPAPYYNALEIGYILFEQKSRNRGLMTEALSLLVGYLFDTKTINRVQLTTMIGNEASKRVALKCGFQSEGIVRKAVFHKGKPVDLEMFSILRDERCR